MIKRARSSPRLAAATVAVLLLGGCSSLEQGVRETFGRPGEAPPAESTPDRDVSVPDLDERRQDEQFLSRIDQLERDLFVAKKDLKTTGAERDKARSEARAARVSEVKIATEYQQMEVLLRNAQDGERHLHAKLLRARIETVRAQQDLHRHKIRDLTRPIK